MFGLKEISSGIRSVSLKTSFSRALGASATAVQISKMRVTNSYWNAKCPVSIRRIFRSASTAAR